jgi:hypothetical protein
VAVGVLIAMPGGTQELYESVNDAMGIGEDETVDGLILHSAGPMEGGWYIYDIWESREQFARFSQDRVGPAVEQVTGQAMSGEPQFFEIANLIQAGQTVS